MPPCVPPAIVLPYCQNFTDIDADMAAQFVRMFVHIWTTQGDQFWMYATHAGDGSLSGYIWQNPGWYYTSLPYSEIDNLR